MNGALKILFADDNSDYCEIIRDYFSTYQDIEIVSIAKDGLQAYEMIIQNEPDIAVLDIIMPYMDGLGVMEKLNANPPRKMPLIIILSAIGQENITQKALSLGAQYYFFKPFNLDLLAARIKQLGSTLKKESNNGVVSTVKSDSPFIKTDSQVCFNQMEGHVTRLIREVGVPAHIKGYQFLRDVIIMALNDKDTICSISKLLYPDIAKRYNTTATRVESAIRHAIDVAWEKRDADSLKRIFGYTVSTTKERPSNSEFIATITDALRLEMKMI